MTQHHETSDEYARVVVCLGELWRVVECIDGIQWIIQRREKGTAERPWRGVSYCTTKRALLRLCGALECGIDPISQRTLDALPERFPKFDREGVA